MGSPAATAARHPLRRGGSYISSRQVMLFHIRNAKRISFPQGPSQVSEWFWWLAICWFPHSTVLAVLFEVLREYGAYVVSLYLHHLLEQQWTECSFLLQHLTGSWLDNLLYAQISIYLFTYPSTRERAQGFSTASAREFILGTRSDPLISRIHYDIDSVIRPTRNNVL